MPELRWEGEYSDHHFGMQNSASIHRRCLEREGKERGFVGEDFISRQMGAMGDGTWRLITQPRESGGDDEGRPEHFGCRNVLMNLRAGYAGRKVGGIYENL